ncbi:MAG: pacearchaeosortase [Candidatus Pacearchaeota archaeon]
MINKEDFFSIISRYLILLIFAISNLAIFYIIFTPLTAYPVYWILGLFFDTALLSNTIIIINNSFSIELIEACIAGSAYYFLLILNLSTPKIKLKTRIYGVIFSFLVFLILNILRISILSLIAISGSSFFDITHKIFWYLVSTILVVGIWFLEVKIFKIKEIPFYSDLKTIYKKSVFKK